MENKNRKIKIVLTTNNFLIGGVQKLILDKLNLMDKDVFEFYVITLEEFPGMGTFYDQIPSGIQVCRLNFKSFFDLKEWLRLIKILKDIKPDIVKSALFLSNTIFRVLKPFFGYKIIAAEHNTEVNRSKKHVFLNRLLAPLTYTIIADSYTVADFVSKTEKIKRSRFTVIYNGVEIKDIEEAKRLYGPQRREIRESLGIKDDEFVFLTVARLVAQKNHNLMIDSFVQLSKKYPKAKLLIVGYGSLRDILVEKIKKLNLEDRVIFTGEQKDIYKFYTIADCYIMTSVREGFSIVTMNALAFGLPVVSTRVAGIIEYVEDGTTGFFADNKSEDIAQKMSKIIDLTDDDRESFKKNAVETASDFSTIKYVDAYTKLFLDCFNSK